MLQTVYSVNKDHADLKSGKSPMWAARGQWLDHYFKKEPKKTEGDMEG